MFVKYVFALLIVFLSLACSSPVFAADCENPAAPEGTLYYSSTQNVPMYCNGTFWVAMGALNPAAGGGGCAMVGHATKPEGYMFYNRDHHVLQYCDGDDWRAAGGGPGYVLIPAPADCPNIGDVCSDGTVYAGRHPLSVNRPIYNMHIFVPPVDQGASVQWKTTAGADDIASHSPHDGNANDLQIPDSISFPAFKICKDLVFGGHTDWYLPASSEVKVLRDYIGTIPGLNVSGSYYWTSSEAFYAVSSPEAIAWRMSRDDSFSSPKTEAHRVRCMRRGR